MTMMIQNDYADTQINYEMFEIESLKLILL